MSNSAVGNVYQQIIADVIEASRVDLEENGVDESILDELKQVSHSTSFLSHSAFFSRLAIGRCPNRTQKKMQWRRKPLIQKKKISLSPHPPPPT